MRITAPKKVTHRVVSLRLLEARDQERYEDFLHFYHKALVTGGHLPASVKPSSDGRKTWTDQVIQQSLNGGDPHYLMLSRREVIGEIRCSSAGEAALQFSVFIAPEFEGNETIKNSVGGLLSELMKDNSIETVKTEVSRKDGPLTQLLASLGFAPVPGSSDLTLRYTFGR